MQQNLSDVQISHTIAGCNLDLHQFTAKMNEHHGQPLLFTYLCRAHMQLVEVEPTPSPCAWRAQH